MLRDLDAARVASAALIQPYSAYAHDNAYHADSAARFPDRLAGVCSVDPLAEDAPDRLAYWIQERGMQGLRLFASRDDDWIADRRTYPVWRRAGQLGIPICVNLREDRLSKLRDTAARFPDVRVCLDHLAAWASELRLPSAGFEQLLDMAELPNLYLLTRTLLAQLPARLGA